MKVIFKKYDLAQGLRVTYNNCLKTLIIIYSFFKVNSRNLAGLFHHDVVKCLKELPLDVCIVCARRTSGPSPLRGTIVNNVDPGKSKQAFASRVSLMTIAVHYRIN